MSSKFIEASLDAYEQQSAGLVAIEDGLPAQEDLSTVHPWVEQLALRGIKLQAGRGKYHNTGANYTVDIAPIRVDTSEPMVQLLERTDTGLWAVPGGFIDPGESDWQAMLREYEEEIGRDIEDFRPNIKRIYKGPVADIRMTANAWPETSAFVAVLDPNYSNELPAEIIEQTGINRAEALRIGWFTLAQTAQIEFYGSHRQLVELAFENI